MGSTKNNTKNSKNRSNRNHNLKAYQEIDEMREINKKKELIDMDYKILSKFKTKKQKEFAETIKVNRITFCKGSSGSGKTFLALKTALELLKDVEKNFGEIILVTPIIEVSEKSLGALPGSYEEKISVYFESLYDNIDKIVGKETRMFLRQAGYIKDKLVNFARGCTFGNYDTTGNPIGSIVVIDEAQNFNRHELITLLTRLGEGSIIICLADTDQLDIKLKRGQIDSITEAIEKLSDIDGIGVFEFTTDDVVRDPFLKDIIKRYKE